MDEEWIIRREIMDEASLFGDRENGAVEAWLASIEASWLEKYALQPEEVGKAVLLVAMEARACLASRFAGLLEQGMDEALDKVDLEGMEQRWGRTYADIAVDARKLAALRRYAKEYATDFAMGGSKAAVEILLRIRVSKDDEGTRRRVMGYVAETMHLPLSLVAEVAGLPSMEPEPAEPAGGGWMAREEAMRLWSDSRGEGCVEGNPEAVASEEDLARRKRRWLKGMSFRHVVSRGLKTLEEERACWREALAERLEAAGRKHADAEAVADAAASEAERWRTAHWESLLEEGRVEALRSPSLEDKAWGFYAKCPSYASRCLHGLARAGLCRDPCPSPGPGPCGGGARSGALGGQRRGRQGLLCLGRHAGGRGPALHAGCRLHGHAGTRFVAATFKLR